MALGPFDTHEVSNQPPSLAGRNLFDADPVLGGTLEGTVDAETTADLLRLGSYWGSAEAHELARLAEGHPPVLRSHDHRGNRLDIVEYHPAYFAIMRRTIEHGLASSLWESAIIDVGARHLARAVRLYLAAQGECGHLAAISSTSAALAALAVAPDLEAVWRPAVCTRRYDHRFIPAPSKLGVTIGVAATEIQAGSDLDRVTTRAEPADAGGYRLVGHKWFLSSPMADAFLTVARTPGGPSLFLMPRFRGDGSTNAIRLVRLKGKLGNRVNATAEAELTGAEARLVGTPGAGLALLARSTAMMRLDRAAISAGIMRAAFAEAVHHVRHRVAFGKALVDQALMQRVLADMALDVAAATALVARVAHAWDNAATDPAEAAYARLMTPIAKYWVTKITPMLVAEAMECVGGASYVEEGPLARLYREAPANMLADGLGKRPLPRRPRRGRGARGHPRPRARRDRARPRPRLRGVVLRPRRRRRGARLRPRIGAGGGRAARPRRSRRRAPPLDAAAALRRLRRFAHRRPVARDLRHARIALRSARHHRLRRSLSLARTSRETGRAQARTGARRAETASNRAS